MTIQHITEVLEHIAPLSLQEEYDNAGLLTGIVAMAVGLSAAIFSKETFGKDLNYIEE